MSTPIIQTDAAGPSLPPRLTNPFFEIGPKNLLRAGELLAIAIAAQHAGDRYGVTIIITAPTAQITQVRHTAPGVLIFAQGMDDHLPGPSVGRVTTESLLDAGAHGVMLNHSDNPLDPEQLTRCIERARANGLLSMVCADDEDEVLRLLPIQPEIILFEPPELIGHPGGTERPWIPEINATVALRAPGVAMMHAGGVATPDDAYRIMCAGADGTGSTSGVLRQDSPPDAVAEFIAAVRQGFDDHRTNTLPSQQHHT